MKLAAQLLAATLLLIAGAAPCSAQTIATLYGGFGEALGVASDASGTVFVADAGFGASGALVEVRKLDDLWTVSPIGQGVGVAQGLATDSSGNIFIAVPGDNAVKEILAAGGYTNVRTLGAGFSAPRAVALDSGGNVFVVDGSNTVKEILAAGGYATVDTLPARLDTPSALAVDRSGNVFVADSGSIIEILAAGGYAEVSPLGGGRFQTPIGVAVDSLGNVFVADAGPPPHAHMQPPPIGGVFEILAAGGYTIVNGIGIGFTAPTAVAVDADDNVFVADTGNGAVKEVVAAGGYQNVATLGGGFAGLEGIALDGAANVFVLDIVGSSISEFPHNGGYATVDTIVVGAINQPVSVALDGSGNAFATIGNVVTEIPASGGYAGITPIHGGFAAPQGIAVDGQGNLFVADTFNNAVKEILAAGGYTTVTTLGSGFNQPYGVAVDKAGNVFVADTANNAVKEIVAAGGYATVETLGSGFNTPTGIAIDGSGNAYVADYGNSEIKQIQAAGGYTAVSILGIGFNAPRGISVDAAGNVFVADTANRAVKEILAGPPTLFAAVLPDSRAVQARNPATIFATLINSGPTALANCQVALPANAVAFDHLTLSYQTTDPSSNTLTGTANTPVTIPGNNGAQTFLVSIEGLAAVTAPAMPLEFGCDGPSAVTAAPVITGVDTLDLLMSSTPIADIIALAATPTNNGIIEVPVNGAGAFAVATDNVGVPDTITASVDTGTAGLPLSLSLCQSNPSNGQCLAAPTPTVSLSFAGGATPTFSVFLQSTGAIPFAPAISRVFVRFEDARGLLHGSTSVAVQSP